MVFWPEKLLEPLDLGLRSKKKWRRQHPHTNRESEAAAPGLPALGMGDQPQYEAVGTEVAPQEQISLPHQSMDEDRSHSSGTSPGSSSLVHLLVRLMGSR